MEPKTFSMPAMTTCALVKVVDMRALPSFSVTQTPPVSANKKLAPVIPTPAST